MPRSNSQKRMRAVLTGAGAGQTVFDFGTAHPGKRIEIKFLQVTTDVLAVIDTYFGVSGTAAATDTGDTASFGPGHVPATAGANGDFNGHGPQSEAGQTHLKADIVGAVTNARFYVEYEVFD